ncbi:MAG TPA: hypothetical protein VH143_07120 [Kofleriaceae bacterium]|jgi:hypothetical protein|nr:hypothetical protein [Kofleriaceae bacterium]
MRTTLILVIAACSNARIGEPDAPLAANVHDASPVDSASPDAAAPLRIIVLNEVSAQSDPDWIEIVNATTEPLDTSQFVFVDKAGAFDKAVPFALGTIGPGALATVDCDGSAVPFKLGSGEELWIYRASDHAVSDGTAWMVGQSPPGGSFARIPDTFGPFTTTMNPTKGEPNEP